MQSKSSALARWRHTPWIRREFRSRSSGRGRLPRDARKGARLARAARRGQAARAVDPRKRVCFTSFWRIGEDTESEEATLARQRGARRAEKDGSKAHEGGAPAHQFAQSGEGATCASCEAWWWAQTAPPRQAQPVHQALVGSREPPALPHPPNGRHPLRTWTRPQSQGPDDRRASPPDASAPPAEPRVDSDCPVLGDDAFELGAADADDLCAPRRETHVGLALGRGSQSRPHTRAQQGEEARRRKASGACPQA